MLTLQVKVDGDEVTIVRQNDILAIVEWSPAGTGSRRPPLGPHLRWGGAISAGGLRD